MKSDFFTRMITTNELGPNFGIPPDVGEKEAACAVYICPVCLDSCATEGEARYHCDIDVMYACSVCHTEFNKRSDANACCDEEPETPKECPICLEPADGYLEAVDCCLHVHPIIDKPGRERIATAVEAGATWSEAVAAEVFRATATGGSGA